MSVASQQFSISNRRDRLHPYQTIYNARTTGQLTYDESSFTIFYCSDQAAGIKVTRNNGYIELISVEGGEKRVQNARRRSPDAVAAIIVEVHGARAAIALPQFGVEIGGVGERV
jgi:hypothetical protein